VHINAILVAVPAVVEASMIPSKNVLGSKNQRKVNIRELVKPPIPLAARISR